MDKVIDIASRHALNLLKTGTLMVISSILSSSLRESTSETMHEAVRDIRMVRNSMRERRAG